MNLKEKHEPHDVTLGETIRENIVRAEISDAADSRHGTGYAMVKSESLLSLEWNGME